MRLNWLRVGRSTVGSPLTNLRNASLNPSERIVALQTTCIKWSASISRRVFSSFVFGDQHIEIAQSSHCDSIGFVESVAQGEDFGRGNSGNGWCILYQFSGFPRLSFVLSVVFSKQRVGIN